MTARIAPADVAAVVARLTEIGAHTEAATVTALATDLDASRLIAPQRDWWAEIAASVGRSCVTLPDVAVAVRGVVQRKDEEIARLRAGASTVGAMVATAPVGTIVEWIDGDEWQRMDARRRLGAVEYWCAGDLRWRYDDSRLWTDTLRLPARLIPADQADADPNTRGPIGGAQ